MPVKVRNLNTAGALPVTRVQDSFNRTTLNPASGPPLWAPLAPPIVTPFSTPVTFGDNFCGVGTDASNALILSSFGQNSPVLPIPLFMPCIGFTFNKINGLTQYCQFTFVGFGTATGGDGGGAVMLSYQGQATQSCYLALVTTGNMFIDKAVVTGGVITLTDLTAGVGGAPANGDVYRLSCAVGSPNTLTLKKNGSTIATVTDGSLTQGVPGFCTEVPGMVAGVAWQLQMRNFDGGVGL